MLDLRRLPLYTTSALARGALTAAAALALTACAPSGPPATATPGSTYEVFGGTPHFDSGCSQEKPTGKLVKGQHFTLVSERDGCWLIEFEDETETYISRPERVRPASG